MARRSTRRTAEAYAKAVVAAVVAALGALGTALTDNQVSSAELVAVAIAFLSAGGGVAWTTNRPST